MVYLSAATVVPIVGADFVSPVVKFVTVGISMVLARGARKAGRVSSAIQFTFWTVLSICWGFTFGAVVSGGEIFVTKELLFADFELSFLKVILFLIGTRLSLWYWFCSSYWLWHYWF